VDPLGGTESCCNVCRNSFDGIYRWVTVSFFRIEVVVLFILILTLSFYYGYCLFLV
jgi:hypothetical protein